MCIRVPDIIIISLSTARTRFQPLYTLSVDSSANCQPIQFFIAADEEGNFFLTLLSRAVNQVRGEHVRPCTIIRNAPYCSTLRRPIKHCGRGICSGGLGLVVHWHTTSRWLAVNDIHEFKKLNIRMKLNLPEVTGFLSQSKMYLFFLF